MNNILVIAAHPDDEVLGCGGMINKFAKKGSDVYTLILGEGVTSRDAKRDRSKREDDIRRLKNNIENANKMLGVKKTFTFDFPDNRFDTVALLDIVKVIEDVKKEIIPEIIYTHFHGDLNIDHRITFEAVMTAFRPMALEKGVEVYSFEIPSSTEWAFGRFSCFHPNVFLDVSSEFKIKLKAMEMYEEEMRIFPHPRSLDALKIQAQHWGTTVGLEYAEAFELIRSVRK